tara:strand:+ start:1521 stop:1901 length:381 start_codon:yes stop_codon:yes gene_type:complete
MKFINLTIALLITAPYAIAGEYQPGFSSSKTCIRNEYREEYVPGDQTSPGYVKTWEEQIEVPCKEGSPNTVRSPKIDNNDCSDGSLIGGILGAGLATSSSRGKDRWWAIPAGAFGGAMIGCQVDGG